LSQPDAKIAPDRPSGAEIEPLLRSLILEHIGQALVILDAAGAVVCASSEVGRLLGEAGGHERPQAALEACLAARPEIVEALAAGRR
jgi:hypothetical protein